PPLRERPEDVAVLVPHLVATIAARLRCRAPSVPPLVLAALLERRWPGNVRELANVLERAVIASTGDELELEGAPGEPVVLARSHESGGRAETLEQATRRCVERALAACRGRIYGPRGAAARLGLKPSTLQGKLAKLGLDRNAFARREP